MAKDIEGSKKKIKAKGKLKFSNKKKIGPDQATLENLDQQYEAIDPSTIEKFTDLPLSGATLKALKKWNYTKPTDIQKATLGLSLLGKDILGAAQTGSGKTLGFIIPILERLHHKKWTNMDGIGALVITPTRELAYQISEELCKINEHHKFLTGLIIGGKNLKLERQAMHKCNIIICTPGRLLHHMDENPLFDCVNMEILVLDEADRCLDMGFEPTMNAIIANLPEKRQTLLFSATQTKSVKDLARLSLKNPQYVSVHENKEYSTPDGLSQRYMVCELKDKVSILWSFIKNHLKQKVIVFLSSCQQVKYVYEIVCKLRPGTSILPLYGTLSQTRRMEIYDNFKKKTSAVLFATDLAARGLDFPEVHWVVQADCPEDAATYIHRVGRTARFHRGGESLLMLLSSELAFVDKLIERKIPIEKIEINPLKLNNPVRKMEAFLARNPTLKDTAQRAFVSYAKSVFLMKDKSVFDVQSLDTDSFANSLGLVIPPRIRFLQRLNARTGKVPKQQQDNKIYFNDGEEQTTSSLANDNGYKHEKATPFYVSDDSDGDDGVLKVKRQNHDIELPTNEELQMTYRNPKKKPLTKAQVAKKIINKKIVANTKIKFNEEGEAVKTLKDKKSEMAQEYENEDLGGIDIEKAKLVLREEDKFDKKLFTEKVKAKHKLEKRKAKEKKKQEEEEEDEEDEFGEEDSDYEPDLSWLPDPDKIYSTKSQEQSETSFVDEEVKEDKTKKRKIKSSNGPSHKKAKLQELSRDLNIEEAEELAKMFLNIK